MTAGNSNAVLSSRRIPIHTRFWLSLRFGVVRKLLRVWAITLIVAFAILYLLQQYYLQPVEPTVELWSAQFFIIALLALGAEYVDSTLGMGYGTTLTPLILLVFGFDPLVVVPAVLISELSTGIAGAISHREAGNLDLSRKSVHLKIGIVLGACSMVGAVIAVAVAINISKTALTLFIGSIVFLVGLVIVLAKNRTFRFSWGKIFGLGLIASFNKALSGGGYGPLVMGGQLLSGVPGKPAIGITSLAEGLTCLVGVILFIIAGKFTDLSLALALSIGAICSLPLCAYTVRQVTQNRLVTIIGSLTLILGLTTLIKGLGFSDELGGAILGLFGGG